MPYRMTTMLSLVSNNIKDGDGSCDVPTVEPLASTSLTCHFNKDLNETKTDFTVFLTIGVNPQSEYSHFTLCIGLYLIYLNLLCFQILIAVH